jgi:hypothetical protein
MVHVVLNGASGSAPPPLMVIDVEGNEIGVLVGQQHYLQLMELLAGLPRSRLPSYWRRALRGCLGLGAAAE